MKVTASGITLYFEEGRYKVDAYGKVWENDIDSIAKIILNNGRYITFSQAKNIRSEIYEMGTGTGILTHYDDFKGVNFSFDTLVWIEYSTASVFFEWIPINDQGFDIKEVEWPGSFAFKEEGFSVIPYMQGVLLPTDYASDWSKLPFDGQLCSSALYMPWLGQYAKQGYMMINETPWDARYEVDHNSEEHCTKVQMKWLPSLGNMSYKRVLQYRFFETCDYNTMCKAYRQYVIEKGHFVTLKEKSVRHPKIEELIGSAFVHKGIKTYVSPKSYFFDSKAPEKNNHLTSFEQRAKEIEAYHEKGIDKLYMHLDGWGQPGYDNQHPDYLPACKEAGGWEGLKLLSDTMKKCGYLFGLHDQYRDYYHAAKTYHQKNSLQSADGGYFSHARWAGGPQDYLCASLAKGYVKRNFEEVLAHDISLDASYLDVFTCNELDECANPKHRMTRKECADAREACFQYLLSKQILPSSEECSDWAIRSLVFAHYGPYEFMMKEEGAKRKGIPVPLFNLVYHECMILPWPMEKGKEDYMLYALLNGGAAYLERDAAYPNIDGAFESENEMPFAMKKERYETVAAFQEKVAKEEMISHTFVDGYHVQKTCFSDGSEVTIDLHHHTFEIK